MRSEWNEQKYEENGKNKKMALYTEYIKEAEITNINKKNYKNNKVSQIINYF